MRAGASVYMYARMCICVCVRVRAGDGLRLYVRVKMYFCEHKRVLRAGWGMELQRGNMNIYANSPLRGAPCPHPTIHVRLCVGGGVCVSVRVCVRV